VLYTETRRPALEEICCVATDPSVEPREIVGSAKVAAALRASRRLNFVRHPATTWYSAIKTAYTRSRRLGRFSTCFGTKGTTRVDRAAFRKLALKLSKLGDSGLNDLGKTLYFWGSMPSRAEGVPNLLR